MSQRAATERLNPGRGRVGHMSRKRRLTIYAVSLMIWVTGVLWLTIHALVSFYGLWTSQDSVDTSTSSSGSFEFLRTYAAQMTMPARWIVERVNVVRDFGLRKLASSVDLRFYAFLLEAAEE